MKQLASLPLLFVLAVMPGRSPRVESTPPPRSVAGPAAVDGQSVVDGQALADAVTIYRDEFGVPHIYGPTDESVVFGAAYAQAEDNWWQVEDNFVRSLGRGSELYGQETLLDDYLARALEIPRLSLAEYERAPAEMRALYDAYAAGFNFFLESRPDVERRLLDRVEPWHTLALIRFKYHHNEYIGYAGLRREDSQEVLNGNRVRDEIRTEAGGTSSALPSLAFRNAPAVGGERPVGSNEWALAGSRTASGYPMLLINPHVPFFGLSQYTEVHLESEEGLVFSGLSRFGFMLPYMGHNERLGWAYTDNYSDIGDLYLEWIDWADSTYRYGDETRELAVWVDTIGVREGDRVEPRAYRFYKTHHGPILGVRGPDDGPPEVAGFTAPLRPLAVRLTKLEEGEWYRQWYEMMRARSLDEWRTAVARLAVPYMNTMYADADGNILYIYNAAIPRRSPDYDWSRPVDGSDPGTEWDGYHALDELPQFLNPETGYLQNTNSNPFTATEGLADTRDQLPPYLVGRETDNARARSSRRLLADLRDATLADFERAALDTRLFAAEEMLAELFAEVARLEEEDPDRAAPLREPVEALRAWDGVSAIESEATTLFVSWAERWDGASRGEPVEWAAVRALERALTALERDWGSWRVAWGEANRVQRPDASGRVPFDDARPSLPVPGAPGWLGSVFTFHTRRAPAGKRGYGVHGNSFVKVVELGPQIRARSVLTFGQSGHPQSPHYFDQAPIYAAPGLKPAWFARDSVEAHAARVYSPGRGRREPGR